MVVNAANVDKDWAWIDAVRAGQVLIDPDRPWSRALGTEKVTVRNLSEEWSQFALQGPRSADILLEMVGDDETTIERLGEMKRNDIMRIQIEGYNLYLARTGYTGEPTAFEIFVHPAAAAALWHALLENGDPFGLEPVGLAARDSLRIEAGLPLYGHELAGVHNISPAECGFASYVKLHKPFFVGRKAYIEKMHTSQMTVIRFRMNEKGIRPPRENDPLVNQRGRCIGWVTSCAAGTDGYLVGMAFVDKRHAQVESRIGVFNLGRKPKAELASIQLGDEVLLHNWGTITPRFMHRQD